MNNKYVMSDNKELHCRRWYDQHPPTKKTVNSILSFPERYQVHIGNGLVLVVETRYKLRYDDIKALRSISEQNGVEAIQALYKASQRQRSWDHIQSMHRAMTLWRLLPEPHQRELLVDALNICKCIVTYKSFCEANNRPISDVTLAGIVTTYATHGMERVNAMLPPEAIAQAQAQPQTKKINVHLITDQEVSDVTPVEKRQPPALVKPVKPIAKPATKESKKNDNHFIAEDGDEFLIRRT